MDLKTSKTFQEGEFCWSELSTTDTAAAKKFYSQLFHWKLEDAPTSGGTYTMSFIQNKVTAAIYSMLDDERKLKIPSHWNEYITVNNITQTISAAEAAGGKILHEPMDVMKHGRMAVVQDPTGAVISFWQPGDHQGYSVDQGMHGAPCWFELMTTDVNKAKAFYTATLGWEFSTGDDGSGYEHISLKGGKTMVGGMMAMPPHMKNTPSYWCNYFSCNDIDTTTQIARSLGATICMEPTEIKGTGKFSVCLDPTGAMFCLFVRE